VESAGRPPALRLVEALANDREATEERFRLGVVAARAAGESVGAIAAAARLSTSRTSEILEGEGVAPCGLTVDAAEWLLEGYPRVVLVPAGKIALADYDTYSAYICQPNRTFRDATRIGFYAHREISPHFPKIRRSYDSVPFTVEEAARHRAEGDEELAQIIERVVASPNRGGHRPGHHKVMLLTPPGDPETITLPQPIKHPARGRGQAFVRRQRYTSEAALSRHPATTADLLRYERE
jgi:hypothetical protein